MGDRTWVHLTILQADVERAVPIIEAHEGKDACSEIHDEDSLLITFEFAECNYGNLSCEKALQGAGIPFDKAWDSGDDYGPGTLYNRYTAEGEPAAIEVYASDANPEIGELLKRIDEPDRLRQYILDHHAKNTPLPWDNQEEYGKRYRARRLIASPDS